jgi:hypothetical protein
MRSEWMDVCLPARVGLGELVGLALFQVRAVGSLDGFYA